MDIIADTYGHWIRAIFGNVSEVWVFAIFILALLWSLSWKGVALWKAAKNHSVKWFIALLIVNTLGLLEIFYIFVFSKRPKEDEMEEELE